MFIKTFHSLKGPYLNTRVVSIVRLTSLNIISILLMTNFIVGQSQDQVISHGDSLFIIKYNKDSSIQKEEMYYKGNLIFLKKWEYESNSYGYVVYSNKINTLKYDSIVEFYSNGRKLMEGHLKKGKKQGLFLTYFQNGQIQCHCYFKDNKRDSVNTIYYENGQIQFVGEYTLGMLNGISKFYYKNGAIWSIKNYKNGKLIAVIDLLDSTGNKLDIGNFNSGNGTVNIYDEHGILIEVEYYKKGKLRKTKKLKPVN